MSPLRLLWRGLLARKTAVLLAVIGVAINVFVVGLGVGLRGAAGGPLASAGDGPSLVVGPAGSALQLVLCGVLLVEPCRGQLTPEALRAVEASPSVRAALPFASGDSVEGSPVFASLAELFEPGLRRGAPLVLASGGPLLSRRADLEPLLDGALPLGARFDAVLGDRAADRLGLGTGDTLVLRHGGGGAMHGPAWAVIGRLAPTGSALDDAVIVDLTGFLAMPEHQPAQRGAPRGVSGAWLSPRAGVHKGLLLARLSADPGLAVADLRAELGRLEGRLGQADRALGLLGALMVLGAALSGGATQWAALAGRDRELALLVVLGARPRDLALLLMLESGLLCGLGGAIGGGGAVLGGLLMGPIAAAYGLRLTGGLSPLVALGLAVMMCGIGVLVAIPVSIGAGRRATRAALGAAS